MCIELDAFAMIELLRANKLTDCCTHVETTPRGGKRYYMGHIVLHTGRTGRPISARNERTGEEAHYHFNM